MKREKKNSKEETENERRKMNEYEVKKKKKKEMTNQTNIEHNNAFSFSILERKIYEKERKIKE